MCLCAFQNWTDSSVTAAVLIPSTREQAIWLKKDKGGGVEEHWNPELFASLQLRQQTTKTLAGFSTWFGLEQLLWDNLDLSLHKLSPALIYTTLVQYGQAQYLLCFLRIYPKEKHVFLCVFLLTNSQVILLLAVKTALNYTNSTYCTNYRVTAIVILNAYS